MSHYVIRSISGQVVSSLSNRGAGKHLLPTNLTQVPFLYLHHMCSEKFFLGYSGFPLSSKTNISKFQFDLGSVCTKIH